MSQSIHQREYLAYTQYIGGLLGCELISQFDANIQLVKAHTDMLRAESLDDGFDIDAQLANYRAGKGGAPVPVAANYGESAPLVR